MKNFNEHTITEAVVARFAGSTTPRVRQISESLVRHLHAFLREVRPTEAEWAVGIDFLTSTGRMCSNTRQEFILLSDTLGATMLVDSINHPGADGSTETTVLGPFYVENPPEFPLGADISSAMPGPKLFIEASVKDTEGRPIPNAAVDIWHSDIDGYYDVQGQNGGELAMRGRLHADSVGHFWCRTIVPQFYPIPNDGPVGKMLEIQGRHPYRPAHVHFMIAAEGFETLRTHVFLSHSPYLDSDVVFGVKDSLIRDLEKQPAGVTPGGHQIDAPTDLLRYDFVLNHLRTSK
jgi:hydroxyquinol 1,2-dioxygenase